MLFLCPGGNNDYHVTEYIRENPPEGFDLEWVGAWVTLLLVQHMASLYVRK